MNNESPVSGGGYCPGFADDAPLYRVVKGPSLFDRIIGAGLMGTNGVLIMAVIGFVYGRINMFVDLAIAYALLNFIGTIAVTKYLKRHRGEAP